jgi:hypothetical protein
VEFVFAFSGAKISRVEQQTLPGAPVPPAELQLTDEIKNTVNGAFDNQTPMMIAYSDGDGKIHLSFRGTIQAYSDDQLAVWARDPEGGLPRHISYPHAPLVRRCSPPKDRDRYRPGACRPRRAHRNGAHVGAVVAAGRGARPDLDAVRWRQSGRVAALYADWP